jgi:pimeloyl-ACP methyl ester carboxylesterase
MMPVHRDHGAGDGVHVTEAMVDADDGVRLFVRVDGNGPHTIVIPAAAWLEDQLDWLRRADRRLVFYDTQARGRSEHGDRARLTFDREIADVDTIRRHVQADAISLIGWSYLGAVVALYASRHPARVRRLALLCPMAARTRPYEGMQPYLDALRAREMALAEELERLRRRAESDPTPETWRDFQLLRASARMGDPRAAERVRGNPWRHPNEWSSNAVAVLDALFDSLDDEFDWRPLMRVVDAPELVIHGALDGPVEPRREWADAFPNGRLVELPGIGHYPFVEAPDDCRTALDAVRTVSPDRRRSTDGGRSRLAPASRPPCRSSAPDSRRPRRPLAPAGRAMPRSVAVARRLPSTTR